MTFPFLLAAGPQFPAEAELARSSASRRDHHRHLARRLARRSRTASIAARRGRRGARAAARVHRRLRGVDHLVHVRDGCGVHVRPAVGPARHLECRLERLPTTSSHRPTAPRRSRSWTGSPGRSARCWSASCCCCPRACSHPSRSSGSVSSRRRSASRSSSRSVVAMPTACCGRCGPGSASRSSKAAAVSADLLAAPDVRAALIAAMDAPDASTREMAAVLLARSPEEDARRAVAAAIGRRGAACPRGRCQRDAGGSRHRSGRRRPGRGMSRVAERGRRRRQGRRSRCPPRGSAGGSTASASRRPSRTHRRTSGPRR